MARVHQISTRDEIPADKGHIFDSIVGSRGRVSGPFSVLLHSPEVAGRAAHLGAYIRFESTLSAGQRELAIISAAREFDCDYEWGAHEKLAREAGVRDEAIQAVANNSDLGSLSDEESLIVQYARDLLREHRVSASTFDAAMSLLGEQGVTDLTATIGYYGMLACALNAFEVQPTADMPKLP